MNISAAIEAMTNGKRVKLPEWTGFWFMAGTQVKAFTGDGDVLDTPWFSKYENRDDFETTEGNLGFDFAIRAMKNGKRIARQGWNGKGMWLAMVKATRYQVEGLNLPIDQDAPDGNVQNLLPWIGMKTADGKFVPWLASQTDMLAEDWVIVTI